MKKKIITIVAFQDSAPNSVAYKKFQDTEKAVAFYKKQLENDNVRVISTRKVFTGTAGYHDVAEYYK